MITATNLYFFDEEFVEQLCPFNGLIFVDGTFDAVQFLSILAKVTSNECAKVLLITIIIVAVITSTVQ